MEKHGQQPFVIFFALANCSGFCCFVFVFLKPAIRLEAMAMSLEPEKIFY